MNRLFVGAGIAVTAALVGGLWVRTPETSADTAAWVQAFGSLLAVGIAVWLQAASGDAKGKQAAKVAKTFAAQALTAFESLEDACVSKSSTMFRRYLRLLEDYLTLDVPLAELEVDLLVSMVTVRALAINALQSCSERSAEENWPYFQSLFSECVKHTREALIEAGLTPHERPPLGIIGQPLGNYAGGD